MTDKKITNAEMEIVSATHKLQLRIEALLGRKTQEPAINAVIGLPIQD